MDEVRIPKERVAILIGKKGEIKNKISKLTKTKIKVDSEEGDVSIDGEDGLGIYNANQIIKAIGRGFNPDLALRLLDDDFIFEVVNVNDYSRNKKDLTRLKSRVIGSQGKAKQIIQDLANVDIVIYGKTIGIIGRVANVDMARHAINNLLSGSKHGNVYAYLEKQRKIVDLA